MPQEFDALTGNFITQEDPRADPLAAALHRSAIATADGTTKPAANDSKWAPNPGNRTRCRVFVESSGSPTGCTIRPYLRSGGSTGHAGTAALQSLAPTPNFDLCFDLVTDGDDVLCLVETLTGGTTPTVSIYLSWR
jgi:hypothetical protein